MAVMLSVCPDSSKAGQSHDNNPINLEIEKINSLMNKGKFQEAAILAEINATSLEAQNDKKSHIKLLVIQAEALSSMGFNSRALDVLKKAEIESKSLNNPGISARIHLLKGSILTLKTRTDEAKEDLGKSLDLASKAGNKKLEALIFNSLGNMHAVNANYGKAVKSYLKSSDLAFSVKDKEAGVSALINASRVMIDQGETKKASSILEKALNEAESLPDDRGKIFALLSICDLSRKLSSTDQALGASQNKKLPPTYERALAISRNNGDHLAESYALGGLGSYHETQKEYAEALDLTFKAILKAQVSGSAESLMRLHWQAGRISNASGKNDAAIPEYEKSVYYIKKTRNDLSDDCRSGKSTYKDIVGPVYLEFVDLLLKKASATTANEEKKNLLKKTLVTLESLKTAEIQDYFKDECITAMESKISSTEAVSSNTAALYPVILPKRTELILSIPGQIIQKTVNIDSDKMTETINNFRSRLENSGNSYFMKDSNKLYDWLIRPIEEVLEKNSIKTIVIIPDGPIRTIPMAALNDGKSFLIEKYSIVTTPGLTLTDPNPLKKKGIKLLMAGLTESVQGFAALPNVAKEADYLDKNFKSKVLQNGKFTSSNIENSVENEPYSILHIATHGQFDRNPSKTFLLTYDGRLTLNDLDKLIKPSKYSENPVELLTLSACQTAVGDDRAALGLAGVAIKSGARCALASLWFIDDEATSRLITRFYDELKKPEISKAEAIQIAQISLLKQDNFRHPAFWSPFLLIGNWL